MSCEHSEVRSLLKSLSGKVKQYKYNLKSQEIGIALYGMQRMDSACPDVQELLKLFSLKIKRYYFYEIVE